jgi:uncharacterized protein
VRGESSAPHPLSLHSTSDPFLVISSPPLRRSILFLASVFLPPALGAQVAAPYERRELSIPMRDGVTLSAVALVPTGTAAPLPILLIRTPFGAAREFRSAEPPPAYAELAKDGYIFVVQDIRGRGASGGSFVTSRPQADSRDPRGVDESTDAWDTVDWLVKQVPGNNGRVGVLGISYRGWLAALAGVHPHPAVRAISPQAPVADTWLGDDFFHNGAFRPTQGVLYSGYIEGSGVSLPDGDPYEVYLRYPNLDSLARAAGVETLPSWRAFREHPAYDRYWQARALQRVLTHAEVPFLFVAGAWDEEDMLGGQLMYRTLERSDRGGRNHFVLGPWSHTTVVRGRGDSLGPIPLGTPTAEYFHREIERPWFAYHLHGKGDGRFPEAWVYETGADSWRTFDRWPAPAARPARLYLREGGELSFEAPTAIGERCDPFVADPAHPVPNAPAGDAGPANWLLADQRFLAGREDVRSWRSAPLTEDLTIAGDVVARLFASTSGTDADWVVKLIDVYPDSVVERPALAGYQLIVSAEVFRGRYRQGFDRPAALTAGRPLAYTIDLHQQLYRFRRGHRLMVQVQGSWFPMFDRNPQTYVPNIFAALPGDFGAQRQCVWRSAASPTHLTFGVLH